MIKALKLQLPNLVRKVLRDADPTSGADAVVVDLNGMSGAQQSFVQNRVASGLTNTSNKVLFLK